ncbi:hypothetical protein [Labedaea rhizosphaerae]|uniref:Membrane-associated oxidoreductase n=1 Tax=Labedaea rhizosphaerae TaxID=598644 RepID=A0A4R6SMI6_LABRH|nr:hypothetical protein [Labedaea rhizosphaerae]TDQ05207.1 hypothetical protein EV186_1011175 [Labedaea rhizosphaerae]
MPGLIDAGTLTATERAVCAAYRGGDRIDLSGLADAAVRGQVVAGLLTGGYPRFTGGQSRIDLVGATVTGELDLSGARIEVVASFSGCTFERPPNLEMAELVGLSLRGCTVPGLHARNLRVRSDLVLESGFTSTGVVDLTDATVDGTVRLAASRLHSRSGRALLAARIRASGSIQATEMSARGEIRLRGAQLGGSLHLTQARLVNPLGDALDGTGLTITGNLHCDRGERGTAAFDAAGRVVLAGARVGGDAVFSGAHLHGARGGNGQVLVTPRGSTVERLVLDADRLRVDGDMRLDSGFVAEGVVGLRSIQVGGHLVLSGATLGHRSAVRPLAEAFRAGKAVDAVPVALVADGAEVAGDLEARPTHEPHGAFRAYGQVRLVDANIHGSATLSKARLLGPGLDVLFADRLQVGGTLFLRGLRARGSIRLQNASIGSSLDCSGARLLVPRLRADGSVKPSLDARSASIGKDLFCSYGFRADGGVRVRMVEVGKMASFRRARLGGRSRPGQPMADKAFSGYGLRAHELALTFPPNRPPRGIVDLTRAHAVSFMDSAELWTRPEGLLLEDFVYESIEARPDVDVRTRLAWLRTVQPDFVPGPYEQLIHVYAESGHEELARRVQLERQRRRYAERGPAGRIWGFLQEYTVGYGYRPWLAIVWLLVFWLLGTLWFAGHVMTKLDADQVPVWNPPLLATDLLLPIVDLGQDSMWRMVGPSQWIAGVLIAVGWILASTAAAGAARVLKRD